MPEAPGVLQQHVDGGRAVRRNGLRVFPAHAANPAVGVAQADIERPAQQIRRNKRIRKQRVGDVPIAVMDEAGEGNFTTQESRRQKPEQPFDIAVDRYRPRRVG